MFQRLDGRLHVFDRAIELLLRIRQRLADLPHDEVHDLLAARHHLPGEILHAGDALRDCHGRPFAAPAIVGGDRSIQRNLRLGNAADRIAAEFDLLQRAVGLAHADRRMHGLHRPRPRPQFSIHEGLALKDRRRQAAILQSTFLGEQFFQLLRREHRTPHRFGVVRTCLAKICRD